MYFVECYESLHCNKVGYIALFEEDAKKIIKRVFLDWDFDLPEEELDRAIEQLWSKPDHRIASRLHYSDGEIVAQGYIWGDAKSELEVCVLEIEPNKKIDLE